MDLNPFFWLGAFVGAGIVTRALKALLDSATGSFFVGVFVYVAVSLAMNKGPFYAVPYILMGSIWLAWDLWSRHMKRGVTMVVCFPLFWSAALFIALAALFIATDGTDARRSEYPAYVALFLSAAIHIPYTVMLLIRREMRMADNSSGRNENEDGEMRDLSSGPDLSRNEGAWRAAEERAKKARNELTNCVTEASFERTEPHSASRAQMVVLLVLVVAGFLGFVSHQI